MPESTKSSAPASPGGDLGDDVWVVVLAGGIGSRFWPVSTPERPKQLLPLASDRPLIVDTVERARAVVPPERIRILAGAHLAGPFRSVLTDVPESGYWIEPKAMGTAPVLVWAAHRLARIDPDAVMVSLHADHRIEPLEAFRETLATAVEVARRDELLLSLGVGPDRVEPGYGHIELGAPLPAAGAAEAYRVVRFHEKPDPETAARYVAEGQLWNTGIFIWKAAVLLEEIHRHAPEIAACLPLLEESDAAFFDAVPVSVIDRAVMERSGRVGTVRASFEWDDVGSWEALSRTQPADEAGNVVVGAGRVVGGEGNIVFVEDGDVVLYGVRDLVVVQTGTKTVLLPRALAPDLKKLVTALETDGS